MTDILLVQPPIQDFYLTAKRSIPYGLACIATALEQSGFSVEILDCLATRKQRIIPWPSEMSYLNAFYGRSDRAPFALFQQFKHFGYSFEHIGRQAKASGAFLVGISSLFTAYSDIAIQTAHTIKSALPDCRIVLGGHHPTAMPEKVMQHSIVDYVLRGEGEASLPLLATRVKRGDSVGDVPGIVYRKKRGGLAISPSAIVENPEDFHLPSTHLLKQAYYRRRKRGSAVVVTSRGCPMLCSYCAMAGIPYRQRSVISVIKEMEQAIEKDDVRFFDFEDENISLHRSWFTAFLDEIVARFGRFNLELRAMNGLYPPTLDEHILVKMKAAGFRTLNLSLGSQDRVQLKRFRRPDVRKAFREAVRAAEKTGLDAVGYIIAGAPGQDPQSSVQDLLYLSELGVLAGMSIFYPAPGSQDFQSAAEAGLLPQQFSLMRSSALPLSHTTTRTDAATLLRLSRIANFIGRGKGHGDAYPDERAQLGEELLRAFWEDGTILGVDAAGLQFPHKVSLELSRQFADGMRRLGIDGSC